MELHFLDERIAKLEAIRSEADCKSISYLVDKVIQKIHDTTGVVFLLNRYGSGFVQENFSQHQSIHCSQPRFKYEKEGADGYRNTVQTMMRQISIDSLTLALKTLPDVINNDILAYNIDEIDIQIYVIPSIFRVYDKVISDFKSNTSTSKDRGVIFVS